MAVNLLDALQTASQDRAVVWSRNSHIAAPADRSPASRPMGSWLRAPQPMHWVGGLFTPGTDPREAFRPFRLVSEFGGIVFIPVVTAEAMPARPSRVP
jgi:hypothetical protein